ncbi:MAG: hypothetical protein IKW45_03790 [Clostridia bacterium]|nr:hypothetical protein [Clostridia bacterium]
MIAFLNNEKISTRKLNELFGKEAISQAKKQCKNNVLFELSLKTEFGELKLMHEAAVKV